jgi:hypothetical protein
MDGSDLDSICYIHDVLLLDRSSMLNDWCPWMCVRIINCKSLEKVVISLFYSVCSVAVALLLLVVKYVYEDR